MLVDLGFSRFYLYDAVVFGNWMHIVLGFLGTTCMMLLFLVIGCI